MSQQESKPAEAGEQKRENRVREAARPCSDLSSLSSELSSVPVLGDYIEAYETAQSRDGRASIADYLPPPSHPLYAAVLKELVRVDMEYGWQRGRPTPLAEYQRRFPVLFQSAGNLQEIAFEEYRLRQQGGDSPAPSDYEKGFGVRTDEWPICYEKPRSRLRMIADAEAAVQPPSDVPLQLAEEQPTQLSPTGNAFAEMAEPYQEYRRRHDHVLTNQELGVESAQPGGPGGDFHAWLSRLCPEGDHADVFEELCRSDPHAGSRLANAVTNLPEEGVEFLGFRLLKELGQGAFARVYLAQQSGLANRYVALKVAANLHGESQTLAQLQHTNIMPIYSMHQDPPFHAVCMPYFGSTTLGHILRDIEGKASLPDSGKGLISTLTACKQSTRRPQQSGLRGPESEGSGQEPTSAQTPVPWPTPPDLELPYGGYSTDTLQQLEGMTYVQAVLWMATRLADGLAHAHERGILHLDLKPANILITDEGQPMLLDFNLAKDLKQQVRRAAAYVGGTLPYMAPEHLEAFRGESAAQAAVDCRSDLFSFGVILYELLTGRTPYKVRRGRLASVLVEMIEDRQRPPPLVRPYNKAVTPAVEAIVRRCLEPDPQRRYQAASELHEDLKRHLENLPLRFAREPSLMERSKKWVRRHPFVTSTSTLVAATVILAAFGVGVAGWRLHELRRWEALDSLNQLHDGPQDVQLLAPDSDQLEAVLAESRAILDRYQARRTDWQSLPLVSYLPAAKKEEVKDYLAEAAIAGAEAHLRKSEIRGSESETDLAAANDLHRLAISFFPPDEQPVSLLRQGAELARLAGRTAEAETLAKQANQAEPRTVRDRCWTAYRLSVRGQHQKALRLFQDALRQDPKSFRIWYSVAHCYTQLARDAEDGGQYNAQNWNQDQEAIAHFSGALALAPGNYRFYLERGYAYLRLKNFELALADFDKVISLNPPNAPLAEAYFHRGLANLGMKEDPNAVRDWTKALDLESRHTRAYFLLAQAKDRSGEHEAAKRFREEGLRREPNDAKDWATRGYAKITSGKDALPLDPQGALADFDKALERDPSYLKGLRNKAYVLSELLGRTEDALAVLDVLVTEHPDFVHGRLSRAVLEARLGRRDAALADVQAVLAVAEPRDTRPLTLYQVACALALTSKEHPEDRPTAQRWLSESVRHGLLTLNVQGYSGMALLEKDPDLNSLREDAAFRRLLDAARTIQTAAQPTGTRNPESGVRGPR